MKLRGKDFKLRAEDVKIGTIEEKAWTDIKKQAEQRILEITRELSINKVIVQLADEMIEKEKI